MSAEPASRVLVIEDDLGVRELLETVLGAAGFDVHSARNGTEGLERLRALTPAAVLLDIMMPDVGGLSVLDELAAEHSTTAVIVVTGAVDAAEVARRRLGPRNVFTKPFDIDVLVERVRTVAAGERS